MDASGIGRTGDERRGRAALDPFGELALVTLHHPVPVRVLVADDDAMLRVALADVVGSFPSCVVVGTAADADEAIDLAASLLPDVAILDVRMPGGGGPRAARVIRALSRRTRILAFSASGDRTSVLDMLRAGATGYIVKGASAEELLDAIRRTADGGGTLSAQVAAGVIDELTSHLGRDEAEDLGRREGLRQIQAIVDAGRLAMHFQPIVEVESGRLAGVEALARFGGWPERSPEDWFAEADGFGLRMELEAAAVHTALDHLALVPNDGFISANLSPATVAWPGLFDLLAGWPGERFVMEITEHARVDDYEELRSALDRLRELGVRLAVDDAGAGYASLRHIVKLAPDFIKLDISLTRDIDTDPVRRSLAVALISFASEIGASIIAEGIETEDEYATLRTLGVTYAQGFHLAPPGPLLPPLQVAR
jgi:EAL domain-containing protein (putative c-di-GMP-specific phosphodiesterase class I)/DNA-binding NarL/FixJ family response regulator